MGSGRGFFKLDEDTAVLLAFEVMCGAGTEHFIAHLVVNDQLEPASFNTIQTSSCIESFEVEVIYDINHPELGIKRK